MFFITYFLLALVSAYVFAQFEIQIEGVDGWASKLPTWKFHLKFFDRVPGLRKPITGYHWNLWLFVAIYPHAVFLFAPWSWGAELLLLSYIVLVLRLEDFLWFVFNPQYGMSKFNQRTISWHKDWIGPIPTPYLYSLIAWLLLFYFGWKWYTIPS